MTSGADEARKELARLKAERSGVGRRILAVDPGTAATGVCLLTDGHPTWIRVVRVKGATADDRLPEMCRLVGQLVLNSYNSGVDTLVVEDQMIRPTDKRPNDILQLAKVIGAVLANQYHGSRLYTPLPVQWKGSADSDAFVRRIKALFPAAGEQMHDVPEHLKHNGYDALGLAVWAIRKALPWQI